jgi:hypothetical protein
MRFKYLQQLIYYAMAFHSIALFEVNCFDPCAVADQILHAAGKLNIISVKHHLIHLPPHQTPKKVKQITF